MSDLAEIDNGNSTDEEDNINDETPDGSWSDENGTDEYDSDNELVEGEQSPSSQLEEEHQKLIRNTIKIWKHYRPRLLHAYSCVAYLLSPHPIIRKHAEENPDPKDNLAVEYLLRKLFYDDAMTEKK